LIWNFNGSGSESEEESEEEEEETEEEKKVREFNAKFPNLDLKALKN